MARLKPRDLPGLRLERLLLLATGKMLLLSPCHALPYKYKKHANFGLKARSHIQLISDCF